MHTHTHTLRAPQVTALTLQGPIGKFACRMRTFATLCLLHDLLLKELFLALFANKSPPRGQMEPMTTADPMDFVDFVEVRGGAAGASAACMLCLRACCVPGGAHDHGRSHETCGG